MQLVREFRWGAAKKGKTKNIVESYPTPLLLINTEKGGSQSVKTRKIVELKFAALDSCLAKQKEQLPEVSEIDFIYGEAKRLTGKITPSHSGAPFQQLATLINKLQDRCPFETVVLDSTTGLSELCIGLVVSISPEWYEGLKADARKWAGAAGAKVGETLSALISLPARCVVVIGHETTTVDEKTGVTSMTPMLPGYIKHRASSLFDQYFYADSEIKNGKQEFFIRSMDFGLVKGLGQRVQDNFPEKCGPRYDDIYERRS